MKKYILTTAIALSCITFASAQDDMYFGSSKKKENTVSIDALSSAYGSNGSKSAYTPPSIADTQDFNPSDYSGSMRSVDEYNRRDRFKNDYSDTDERLTHESESILISKEDYEYAMKMKKYDGYNNVTLVINNDPWYDPWYWDSYYYDPWYRHRYYSSYWYDPWYRPGFHFGIGWGGWSIGWGYTWSSHYTHYWHRPYYYSHSYVRPAGRYYSSWSRGGVNNRRVASGTRYTNVSSRNTAYRNVGSRDGQRTINTATRPGNISSGNRGFSSYEQRNSSTPSSSYSGSRSSSSYGSSRSSGFSGSTRSSGFSGASRGGGGMSVGASRGGARR